METYSVYCLYKHRKFSVVKTGLTKEEAFEMCNTDEGSSSTCKSEEGLNRTAENGVWLYVFSKEHHEQSI